MDLVFNDFQLNRISANILGMFILGVGSFLFGILPICITARNRGRCPLLISALLCFGAGVLLATAIVHMLPDAREGTLSKYSEIIFCVGFLLVYAIDELVHFCFGEVINHSHGPLIGHEHRHSSDSVLNRPRQSYGTVDQETEALLTNNENRDSNPYHAASGEHQHEIMTGDVNARLCPVRHTENSQVVGTFGLLCALLIHSFLEGLAIGVQPTGSKIMLLVGAVACHKLVVAFCLGIELSSHPLTTMSRHVMSIVVFSLGSVLGMGIGMAMSDLPSAWKGTAFPLMQGLAGGTLLYVTVSEVMPRERARWHENGPKSAGIIQFIASAIGFTAMTLINLSFDD